MKNKTFRKFIWWMYLSKYTALIGKTATAFSLLISALSICAGDRWWYILPNGLSIFLCVFWLGIFLIQIWLSSGLHGIGYPKLYSYTKEELHSYGMDEWGNKL